MNGVNTSYGGKGTNAKRALTLDWKKKIFKLTYMKNSVYHQNAPKKVNKGHLNGGISIS